MVAPVSEFLTIAWPALLALAAFLALIGHATWDYRRRHPRGRYSVRFEGPLGILTAEHELTEQEAARIAGVARRLVGEPLAQRYSDPEHAGQLQRAMRSAHSRGLHRGTTVLVPACPDCGDETPGNAWAGVGWEE
jgi:hypothetical protein